jgi:hypothetical protein
MWEVRTCRKGSRVIVPKKGIFSIMMKNIIDGTINQSPMLLLDTRNYVYSRDIIRDI